jgi:hypothetical protein
MREGTRRWKQTAAAVLALLTDLDPYGLEPGQPDGAPADEYDLEAPAIARQLLGAGSIGVAEVDEIWLYWFSERLSDRLRAERMEDFVASLNRLVQPTPEAASSASPTPRS